MKTSTTMKSALALALGLCASGAYALTTTNAFESFTCENDTAVTNLTSIGLNWSAGADAADYTYAKASTGKLVVDTGDSSVTGTLSNATAFNNNIANSASFEAKVSFTPATETPTISGDDLRFALYAKAVTGSTNLFVYANGGEAPTGIAVPANVEKSVKVTFAANDQFSVFVNDVAASGNPYTFANSGTISKVEFQGNGEVDDLGFTYTATPFTITFSGLVSASYTVNGGTPVALTAAEVSAGTFTYYGEPSDVVVLTGVGDAAYKTATATAVANSTTALGALQYSPNLADYFANGAGTEVSPYQIATVADLVALKDAVANVAASRDKYYEQTADIDMASAGAFAGIGAYKKVPTEGTPFTGTYNGQGYMIKNVTRAGGDTQGVFNQVGVGGTIENLVVSNMVFDAGLTGQYGFAIVGNAGGGATLRNLTAAGVFGAADKASSHNMAGIVVRVCGGATADVATTIDSCTNNATIYGGYTKLGGICAIVQQQTGFSAGKVVFNNCANNGTLVCKSDGTDAHGGAVTGNAGIIGYTSANNVELTGCYGNGTITNSDGANTDRDGALIGWQYSGYTLKDNGGNSAPANKKMIAYYGNVANVTGFQYAKVDNGVATTVSGALAAGNIYLLEGNAAPTFQLDAAGDTIAFDTALGYTLTDTGITVASGLKASNSISGTVKTYGAEEDTFVENEAGVETSDGELVMDADMTEYLNAVQASNSVSKAEIKAKIDTLTTTQVNNASLLNEDILKAGYTPEAYTFGITSVKRSGDNVVVTIELDRPYKLGDAINGTLSLKVSSDGTNWTNGSSVSLSDLDFSEGKTATATLPKTGNGNIFKAVIE